MADPYVQRDRGMRAQALLENEMLQDAFKQLDEKYVDMWKHSRPEGRDACWYMVASIAALREHLQKVVTTGNTAALIIEDAAAKEEQ